VAVRKAVAAAVDRISEIDPLLGRLLTDTVHTGSSCRYAPDPSRPVEWRTD
jgi:tRNA G37 N-methylase Trm5